jgi:hypothetical protein
MLSQLTAGKRLGSCPVKSARAAVGGQGVCRPTERKSASSLARAARRLARKMPDFAGAPGSFRFVLGVGPS